MCLKTPDVFKICNVFKDLLVTRMCQTLIRTTSWISGE